MAHIVGCVAAKELTTCKRGANQHAHIVARKNVVIREKSGDDLAPESQPASEAPEMSVAVMKRIASMSDVTKTYFVALDDTAAEEFLKKAPMDQDKEAEDAKKKSDEAAAAEKAKAEGITAEQAETRKAIDDLTAVNAELLKRLDAADVEKTLEARARDEFAGFPGGATAAVARLKSIAALPEADRKPLEDMMKSQILMAKSSLQSLGHQPTEEELSKSAPATAAITEKAKALVAADPTMSMLAAKAKVMSDPANSDLLLKAMAEERTDQTADAA